MTPDLRNRSLSAIIFFVLIVSAVFTVPARADSGSPPPAPTAPGGSTHNAAQVPSGMTNSGGSGDQGHKVELSNQNAAYIAPVGDPIWCPSGVAVPVPGAGGCSANYGNLYLLTSAVEGGTIHPVLTNSNIWIQHGADSSASPIFLDGGVLPALSNVSLNFKGGWNGLGTGSVNPATPSIFNGVGFSIANWHNNVTMSNIVVNHAPPGQTGIIISSTKNISLTNMLVSNGGEYGAYLDDRAGTGVTIMNSLFTSNDLNLSGVYGLWVYSMGPITVTNLNISGNEEYGAYLDNSTYATSPQNMTFNGVNIFASNGFYGLDALSKGKITSASIIANKNGMFGARFDNVSAATALPVTLTGNSIFTGNAYDGLDIFSKGAISANNLLVNGNMFTGAYLENNYDPTSPSPEKLTGTNVFTNNGYTGLFIYSLGALSLNNINANGNGTSGPYNGLFAQNYLGALTPQSISLTGKNTFNDNSQNGATLLTKGKVSVTNMTAIGNIAGFGVTIDNSLAGSSLPQAVTMTGTNLLTSNKTDNLDIYTYGAITISGLTASDSLNGDGANLGKGGMPANVTLKGMNIFNNNALNGLSITSAGAVLTNGLTALSNGSSGVDIDNTPSISSSPVTMNGLSTFNFNGGGLLITSNGSVLTKGLTAISNGSGVTIVEGSIASASPVTLKGINTINNSNGGGGLTIVSYGAVTLNNLTVNYSSSAGLTVVNNSSLLPAPVTLVGLTNINFNGSAGLTIVSKGAVLIHGLNAISNGSDGAYIANNSSSLAPVTLMGLSNVSFNNGVGLTIHTQGNVVTNGLNAISNTGDGVYIDPPIGASSVTLNGINTFNFNTADGLHILSRGTVLTNNLTALSNGSTGADIENNIGGSTAPVTLKGINTFNSNISDGLAIFSGGAVVTNGLTAVDNHGTGVFIANNSSSTSAPVTLMGFSTLNFNHLDGLNISTNGPVLTNGLNVMNNGGNGVSLFNASLPAEPVTLKGLNTFNNNIGDGLYLVSNGAVVTNNLSAMNNHNVGAVILNFTSTIFAPVTLNGVNTFNSNTSSGLIVFSMNTIKTNNLTANDNGSGGALLENNFLGAIGSMSINGRNTFLDNNNGSGLALLANGPVTVTNISSKWNYNDGLLVDSMSNVIVSCGKFVDNGTSHSPTGYGWETTSNVLSIKLIGVMTAGNFTGDYLKDNAGTVVTVVPHPCSLP